MGCRAAPKTAARRDAIVSKALPMEVAMLADEGAFIGGVALTMTAITLLVSLQLLQHGSRLKAVLLLLGAISDSRSSGVSN